MPSAMINFLAKNYALGVVVLFPITQQHATELIIASSHHHRVEAQTLAAASR